MPEPTSRAAGTSHDQVVQSEFERAASTFGERTAGRFDHMDVVAFSGVQPGATIVELGAGTGNFLALFAAVAGRLIAVDFTAEMLAHARARFPALEVIVGDARRVPLRSRSVDLVASAQAFHHMHDPLAVVKEMRRLVSPGGRILVVDQVAPEKVEQVVAMHELEVTRDPSHAGTRPASAFRTMIRAAGLDLVDEQIHSQRQPFSKWMWPGEFPSERMDAVLRFLDERAGETGMDFERREGEWWFTRRRIMVLAERPEV